MLSKTLYSTLIAATLSTSAMAWPNDITITGAEIQRVTTSGCLMAHKSDANTISVNLKDMSKAHSKTPPNCFNIGYVYATLSNGKDTCQVTFSGEDLNAPDAHITYYCCGFDKLSISTTSFNDPKHPFSNAVVTSPLNNGCRNQ